MAAPEPEPSRALQAIETYVRLAYEDAPPVLVKAQLTKLRSAGSKEAFYKAPVFTRDLHTPPTQYTLRLGNKFYPHMKLSMKLSPDDKSWLFRADTHDGHVCPPAGSTEYTAFRGLMERNQKLAEAIEAAWAAEGLPTFKTYLRDDLARRQAQAPPAEGASPGATTP